MPESDKEYSEAEATRRMNDAVRRALAMPHKPHKPLGKRKKKRTKRGKK